jgi:hypothetical protein
MIRIVIGSSVLVIAAAAAILLWSNWRWSQSIDGDIRRLTAAASQDVRVVTEDMLRALPAPVQRYLAQSGVVGRAIPNTIRLTQSGRIRSGKDASWMNLEAEEFYSTNPPAFVWKASLPARSLPVVLGRDEYLDGQGSILMKMGSLFPVAQAEGGALNEAALMRYLNEMMWFPAAFLGSNVTWTAIDDGSAQVALGDRGMSATATMFFDAEGKPVNFRATRFNTTTGKLETWETPVTAYGTFAGVNLPVKGSAVWKLADGDVTYIELEIPLVEYDLGR